MENPVWQGVSWSDDLSAIEAHFKNSLFWSKIKVVDLFLSISHTNCVNSCKKSQFWSQKPEFWLFTIWVTLSPTDNLGKTGCTPNFFGGASLTPALWKFLFLWSKLWFFAWNHIVSMRIGYKKVKALIFDPKKLFLKLASVKLKSSLHLTPCLICYLLSLIAFCWDDCWMGLTALRNETQSGK